MCCTISAIIKWCYIITVLPEALTADQLPLEAHLLRSNQAAALATVITVLKPGLDVSKSAAGLGRPRNWVCHEDEYEKRDVVWALTNNLRITYVKTIVIVCFIRLQLRFCILMLKRSIIISLILEIRDKKRQSSNSKVRQLSSMLIIKKMAFFATLPTHFIKFRNCYFNCISLYFHSRYCSVMLGLPQLNEDETTSKLNA